VTHVCDPTAPDPFSIARTILQGRGFHPNDQEALAVVAALIENYHYLPSQIHPDRVPESWLRRMKEIWATPPGFRESVLDALLVDDYRGTEYYHLYKSGVEQARVAFRLKTEKHDA
jgi:hypothetical protein